MQGTATADSVTLNGLEAHRIRVEVDSGRGPTGFWLVGLPEASVRESRIRVRASLRGLGIDIDEYVLTVNLAPADLRKSGSGYDLAIAVGALGAVGKVPLDAIEGVVFLGELSLTGDVRPVRGVLPALLGARRDGLRRAIVPAGNGAEAALVEGLEISIAEHLEEVVRHLVDGAPLPTPAPQSHRRCVRLVDMSEVRGQPMARRALEVAAAGGHNLLLLGPPGAGKTMLARRMPTILPPLGRQEAIEVSAVHSVAGLLPPNGWIRDRPFRAPHHSATCAALVGGGSPARPGEVSLAHHGCLFLDELPEFRRGALEALRQPLEDGHVAIARARTRGVFPAQPTVVAAANPCPCGYWGDAAGRCRCSPKRVREYRSRMSGPLLDRLDIHLRLPPVEVAALSVVNKGPAEESSAAIRERVTRAREIQAARQASGDVVESLNARLTGRDLERVAAPDHKGAQLLGRAATTLGLSARAYGKILKIARTVADLDGSTSVQAAHVAEAVQARLLDRD